MSKDTQYRNMCGAAYNDEHLKLPLWRGVSYYVHGKEICPKTGKTHYQYYCEFKTPKRFSTIKKAFPKLHFESRFGTAQQAANYCKKGEQSHEEWKELGTAGPNYGKNAEVFEIGEMTQQGNRVDLKELCAYVRTGKKTLDDILCENPLSYHQYGRTLQACEDYYFRNMKRTEMTKCIWYYGPTGVGKSHKAYTDHPDAYTVPYDGRWWDGYRNQDTVILNDFRGQIPYNIFLNMVDKWPYSVSVRNRQPRPFTSKLVIVTSSLPPDRVYHRRDMEDDIEQMLRRVTVINMKKRKRPSDEETQ